MPLSSNGISHKEWDCPLYILRGHKLEFPHLPMFSMVVYTCIANNIDSDQIAPDQNATSGAV